MFRVFERDFAGESPLYQRLSGLLAERTDLATPLLSAPHGQRRALLLFAAIQQNDYFVIYGVVFILVVMIATLMLLVDVLYPLLDPRVRR